MFSFLSQHMYSRVFPVRGQYYNINIWCNISEIYSLRILSVGGRQSLLTYSAPRRLIIWFNLFFLV